MSLDRRIVSILYHNGITDVSKVEKFIGENNNYYEVVIDGKIEKLKIPGNIYNEDLVEDLTQKLKELGVLLKDITELNPETEEEKNLIKEVDDEFNKLESFSNKLKVEEPKILIKELTVEEQFSEVEKSSKNQPLITSTYSFEEELEKIEVENKNFLDDIKKPVKREVKKTEVKKIVEIKKSEVKTKSVKPKKLDDDINDFIDLA
jgi:hypothetical protein